MQLSISTTKEALLSPLAFVSGAADQRATLPILGTTLIKTVQGKLSLLCSDGAVLARSLADCKVEKEGEIAVDARRLGDLIRAMPDKQAISLSLDKEQLLVKAGRSRFKLPVHAANEYPTMAASNEGMVTIQIGSKRLGEMFDEVSHAMGVADVRSYLNGTYLTLKEGALWAIATDGHRMAISRQAITGSEKIVANEVIVPRKSSQLARKLLATSSEDVTLVFGNKEFRLQFKDGTVLLSKCLEGKFPDWQRVIPQNPNTTKVATDKLRTALTMIRATIDNSEATKKNATRRACSFVFGKTGIAINHADVASSEVEADSDDASNERVSLNVDYIADATDAVSTGDAVRFGFDDGNKPVTVRPADADYPLLVVMPMKD